MGSRATSPDRPLGVVELLDGLAWGPEQSRAVAARAHHVVEVVCMEGADHSDQALFNSDELIGAVVRLAEMVDVSG